MGHYREANFVNRSQGFNNGMAKAKAELSIEVHFLPHCPFEELESFLKNCCGSVLRYLV